MKFPMSFMASVGLLASAGNSIALEEPSRSDGALIATVSIDRGISRGVSKVLQSARRFAHSPSPDSGEQLAADVRLLTINCVNFRDFVRDSGWPKIRSAVEEALDLADESIKRAVQQNSSAEQFSILARRLIKDCRSKNYSSISR